MKRIALLLALITVIFTSCDRLDEPGTSDWYYYDVKAVVVQVGTDIAPDHTKYHRPTEYHILLCRMITCKDIIPEANGAKSTLNDTTLYTEHKATPSRYYSTQVGDTLTWEYINKNRWFKIKRK